jgi:multiple sugar transport system permease protein
MNRRISPIEKIILYLVLTAVGIAMAAPFIYMLSVALASDRTTTMLTFTFLPKEFEWRNFIKVFTEANLDVYLRNSLIIAFFNIVGQVLASSLVAYGFARLRAPGKNLLFLVLLSTMMIPGEITIIPQFVVYRHLKWINTFLPLTVPAFFGGAYNIFLIRQFITRIPTELDEAAMIDGLGPLGIYWRIILPLIKPILVAVSIFTFAWTWGWFMGPLIYINDAAKMPMALAVQILSATHNAGAPPRWNLVMVGSLMLTLPPILLFFWGQRYVYQANIGSGSSSLK